MLRDSGKFFWLILLMMGGAIAASLSFVLPQSILTKELLSRMVIYAQWFQLLLLLNSVRTVAVSEFWDWRKIFREWMWPVGVGSVVAVIIHVAIEREFRVLADETNLIGSSLSLFINGLYQNVTEGVFYYDRFHPLTVELDGRPWLFPFLMYICHSLFGYSAYHGFLVNMIATALSLALLIRLCLNSGSRTLAGFAVSGMVGFPIFLLCSTSSGFEVLNQLLLLTTFFMFVRFFENPTVFRLELLILVGVLASGVRYESILVLLPIGIAALFHWKELSRNRTPYTLFLAPFLLVPLIWQKRLVSALNGGDNAEIKPFALHHWVEHSKHLIEYIFDPKNAGYPMAPLISILAVAGFLLFLRNLILNKDSRKTLQAGLSAVALLMIVSVQLSYYLGDPRQPFVHRFALTYAPVFAYFSAVTLDRLARFKPLVVLTWVFSVYISVTGFQWASANQQGKSLTLFREYKSTLKFILTQPRAGTLVVADRPGMFTVHRYGAVSGSRFSTDAAEFKMNMRRQLYTNVLIEQKVYYHQAEPSQPAIPAGFLAETLFEYQNDSRYLIRISRLSVASD